MNVTFDQELKYKGVRGAMCYKICVNHYTVDSGFPVHSNTCAIKICINHYTVDSG